MTTKEKLVHMFAARLRVIVYQLFVTIFLFFFFFQAEYGIRDLVRARGLVDVYNRHLKSVGLTYIVFPIIGSLCVVRSIL